MVKKTTGMSRKAKGLLVFGILLLVAGASYKIYAWQAVRADKQRFAEASALVDKIYADIVAELGQPEDHKRTNSCSRTYQEFSGYGDPTCSVGIRAVYGVVNRSEADSKLRIIQKLLSKQASLKIGGTLSTMIADQQVGNNNAKGAFDEYRYYQLRCTAKYLYDTPGETLLSAQIENMKSFYVAVVCSGLTKSQIYPSIQ